MPLREPKSIPGWGCGRSRRSVSFDRFWGSWALRYLRQEGAHRVLADKGNTVNGSLLSQVCEQHLPGRIELIIEGAGEAEVWIYTL